MDRGLADNEIYNDPTQLYRTLTASDSPAHGRDRFCSVISYVYSETCL